MIRVLLATIYLFLGAYTLLAYLPFTFHQFIETKMFPSLHAVIPWLQYIAMVGLFFCQRLFGQERMAIKILTMFAPIYLVSFGVLSQPTTGFHNFVATLLLFSIAIGILWEARDWESTVKLESQDYLNFMFAMIWSFLIRTWQNPDNLLWLFSLKLLIIFVFVAVMSLFRHFMPRRALIGFNTLLYTLVLYQLVFPTISFRGPEAILVALILSTAIALVITTTYRYLWISPKFISLVLLFILTTASIYVDYHFRRADWDGVGLLFFSIISTSFAGIIISAILRSEYNPNFRGYHPYFVGTIVLIVFHLLGGFRPQLGDSASEQILRKIATVEKSNEDDLLFFQFLHQNSNLSNSVSIRPTSVSFASSSPKQASQKPNIFVFVIDSLRRDALSPYNFHLHNTPNIEAFAKEGLVFQNAFTRYGGTALSEPAIWAGTLIPHKQYAQPFGPMNTLEKMLNEQSYSQFISMDEILSQILTPNQNRYYLDKGKASQDFQLCRTLDELKILIDQRKSTADPIFVYSQAQDLHISVLAKSKTSYGETVSGIDQCLGKFVERLKQISLYENSIIILTSDHGDSRGEQGRLGHAYTLFPEVVRVPLLIHLPVSMQKRFKWDLERIVFTNDVSPTLHQLLEIYEPQNQPILGRPLTQTHNRTGPYLLSSSYGPVFAIINRNETEMYIADGVHLREYLYRLGEGDQELILDETDKTIYREMVKEQIQQVSEFYGIKSESGR